MERQKYYEDFGQKLLEDLLRRCTESGLQAGVLLETEDLTDKWDSIARDYLSDAIEQLQEYPEAAIAWAGFLGLAYAQGWDENWDKIKDYGYAQMQGERGFDDLDEHILQNWLGYALDSEEARKYNEALLSCAQTAITHIRSERIEPQSVDAFYIFAEAVRTLFRIGASLRLYDLGYRFEKVPSNQF